MKQMTKQELRNRIIELEEEVNNFPSYAITAISKCELSRVMRYRDDSKLRFLIDGSLAKIEKWDLKVDYMLIPKEMYKRFCKTFKRKKSFWRVRITPIFGLESVIFFSNVRC